MEPLVRLDGELTARRAVVALRATGRVERRGKTVHLRYISKGALIMFAGGDPWTIDGTLQSGRPAQISNLAQAFHDAGQSTGEADAAFTLARNRFATAWIHQDGENPINDSAEVQQVTRSLGAQAARLPKIGADLENVAAALAEAQRSGRAEISALEGLLQALDDQIGEAVELEKDPRLTESERQLLDHYINGLEKHAINDTKASVAKLNHVRDQYSRQLQASMANLRKQGGYEPPIQALYGDLPTAPPPNAEERRRNQIEAFKQVFGREPTSAADWETAAALDPQTYDPKFGGTKSEVRVVKIRPVPGQGVVRVSQWIEQRDVTSFPPWKRDLGNNRGPNPNFDPEDTKVTTYIDYENGIVVLRQNPSVEENSTGGPGQVKVGIPKGSVTQLPDGSVRIKYDAGNPFAPGVTSDPNGPFAGHTVTVNGDLVFTPGQGGVQVNGTRTDYPSLEVYQDLPNGGTRTVLIDPAQSGRSWGPAFNLPGHHDVGPIGGKAFAPFDTGGWSPKYDVPAPLPATEFGPVTEIPSVPPLPTGSAVPA
ncbi:putative alpha/beta hydrolase [Mycobacterium malmoense]|uniref:putative alpha/beta hydrolase n=1 Tax=Mycobacterium malmoense TaxID=1780 RepID=UPI003F8C8B61